MSEVKLQHTTKGGDKFAIEYEERGNMWRAEMADEYVVAASLRELKEKLEKKTTPKAKARRIPCLVMNSYHSTLAVAHATSVDDHNQYVRVTYEKGTREQLQRSRVYADSAKNRELMVEIANVHAQEKALHSKMQLACSKLDLFDLAQLKDD